jgi:hypothetical protein
MNVERIPKGYRAASFYTSKSDTRGRLDAETRMIMRIAEGSGSV